MAGKALITGGAGFIGSHLAAKLLDDGWDVWVLDDLSTGSLENIAHLPPFNRKLMFVVDVLISAAAATAKVRTWWLNTIGGGFPDIDKFSLRELFFLADDFGGNCLAINRKRDKNRFAVFTSDSFSAERNVPDFKIDDAQRRMLAWQIAYAALGRNSFRCDCALHRCFKFFELHRFDQMLAKPCLQTFFDVPVVAEAADGNTRHFGNGLQLSHQFDAASVWQRNIADQKIETIARRGLHRRAHIVRRCHEMSAADK